MLIATTLKRWMPASPELVLFMVAGLLFFFRLGARDLWAPDEPRVAGIAAEMTMQQDWSAPRLNGHLFLEKPPLFFWGTAAAFQVFGISPGPSRLLSAAAALGTVWLVFLFLRTWRRDERIALYGGLILAGAAQFWSVARRCVVDMQLTFFITAAIVCFYLALQGKKRRWAWELGYVAAMAGALMSKGLVGAAVPGSALTFWLLFCHRRNLRAWLVLFGGSALALLPVCVWLGWLYARHGREAVYIAAWVNNIGRFTGSYAEHAEPWFYYLKKLPKQLLPGSLLIPFAIWRWRNRPGTGRDQEALSLILCWLGVPFLLLSIASGKRGIYLLPLYPAMAMLASYALAATADSDGAWFCSRGKAEAKGFAGVLGVRLGLAPRQLFERFFLFWVVVLLIVGGVVEPWLNTRQGWRPVFQAARSHLASGERVALYVPPERLQGAAVFYWHDLLDHDRAVGGVTGKHSDTQVSVLKNQDALETFLALPLPAVVVGYRESLSPVPNLRVLGRFPVGRRHALWLVTRAEKTEDPNKALPAASQKNDGADEP